MTELKARSASVLKSFRSSVLKAFGLKGLILLPGSTDVSMVWSVEFILYNHDTDTKLSTTVGSIILHDRWFHTTFSLMATSNNRGDSTAGSLKTQAFDAGTPEPVNGLHQDGNLSLVSANITLDVFRWRGWIEIDGDGQNISSHIDTGSAIEFRGNVVVRAIPEAGSTAINGFYIYDPNVLLGAPHTIFGVDKWIMIYCDGAGGLVVDNPAGPDNDIRIQARIKCVVTLP